jgi:GT2 family glycosyltransferase
MTQKAKVSVVLTSYNYEEYLQEAIDSVLNQIYRDFELFNWEMGQLITLGRLLKTIKI